MISRIDAAIAAIQPVDESLTATVQAHLDNLTKPRGSLGRLEEVALRYARARGDAAARMGRKRIVCFAGDHGVADEGVSAFPKAVTRQMVLNMLAGGAAVNVFARHAGAELQIVDIGVEGEFAHAPGLVRRKVRGGTANIARGAAMTRQQAEQAVLAGMDLAADAAREGITLLGTGEMGIANTTPSAALFAAFLGLPIDDVVGAGTGVDAAGVRHKADVIRQALAVNAIRPDDPLGTLAALGGLEIAGICGLILGGAAQRLPVVVDGFISCAGALAAMRLCPHVGDYLFFAHLSHERGHRCVLDAMQVRPILHLDMRLGEGTGAALAMGIVEASLRMYHEMATFSAAGLSQEGTDPA